MISIRSRSVYLKFNNGHRNMEDTINALHTISMNRVIIARKYVGTNSMVDERSDRDMSKANIKNPNAIHNFIFDFVKPNSTRHTITVSLTVLYDRAFKCYSM